MFERIMKAITTQNKVDFLLYIGDDSSNEEVFSLLNQSHKSVFNDYLKKDGNIFTCTVGKKPSNAKLFLKDSMDICNLLRSLSAVSQT